MGKQGAFIHSLMSKVSKKAKEFYKLLENEGYIVIEGVYINAKTPLRIKYRYCDHEPFDMRPDYFKGIFFQNGKNRCPKCRRSKSGNNERFGEELSEAFKGEYIHIDEYINRETKIRFKHVSCGEVFEELPRNILFGKGQCPECENKEKTKRLTKRLHNQSGDEFEIVRGYCRQTDSIEVKHKDCGRTHQRQVGSLYNITCKHCFKLSITKTQEQFEKDIYDLVGDEYKVASEYTRANELVSFYHSKCDDHSDIVAGNFLFAGTRCQACSPRIATHEQYVEKVEELGDGEYEVLSEYLGSDKPITLLHRKCGRIWSPYASSFTSGHRCADCKGGKSYDALRIKKILADNNLFFLDEYKIEKCINRRQLPFDFAIIRNKDMVLIEYDGEQHFTSIEAWGGEEAFKETILRDKIKNKYCIDNKIPLIRIPYWETNNIEYIINNILGYFNFSGKACIDRPIVEKYYVRKLWSHEDYLGLSKQSKDLKFTC